MADKSEELEAALRANYEALMELMACSSDLLNSHVGRHLYKQCHKAVMMAGPLLPVRPYQQQAKPSAKDALHDRDSSWMEKD